MYVLNIKYFKYVLNIKYKIKRNYLIWKINDGKSFLTLISHDITYIRILLLYLSLNTFRPLEFFLFLYFKYNIIQNYRFSLLIINIENLFFFPSPLFLIHFYISFFIRFFACHIFDSSHLKFIK